MRTLREERGDLKGVATSQVIYNTFLINKHCQSLKCAEKRKNKKTKVKTRTMLEKRPLSYFNIQEFLGMHYAPQKKVPRYVIV